MIRLFHKKADPQKIPEPFTADDIRVESSICSGEKTIGFYDKGECKLRFAELVRTEADIRMFYQQYGLELNERTLEKLTSNS